MTDLTPKLSRFNQKPTKTFAEPVVYVSKNEVGANVIEVVDRLTGDPIRFGGVAAAAWQFALLKGEEGQPDRAVLQLTLDSPTVIQV